jgi:hypothetical protein
VQKLQSQLSDLSGAFYKNNFSSSQTFNKDVVFQSRMRSPVFSAAPAVGEIGDIICVSAKLYVCTTAGNSTTPAVFSLIGSQI